MLLNSSGVNNSVILRDSSSITGIIIINTIIFLIIIITIISTISSSIAIYILIHCMHTHIRNGHALIEHAFETGDEGGYGYIHLLGDIKGICRYVKNNKNCNVFNKNDEKWV